MALNNSRLDAGAQCCPRNISERARWSSVAARWRLPPSRRGDAAAARRGIDGALAIDPRHAAARHVVGARADAEPEGLSGGSARRAVVAHEDSVAAHVAAAETAQAAFDLETARRELDRAVAIDPSMSERSSNRARCASASAI